MGGGCMNENAIHGGYWEEDGAADTDYAADMAAAQNTWDPWPTPAQNTSLPAKDAPSSPQDDPTPAQKDRRQDLIYFLLFRYSFFFKFKF